MESIKCEECDKEFKTHEALVSHNSAKHTRQKIKMNTKLMVSVVGVMLLLAIVGGYFFMNARNVASSNQPLSNQPSLSESNVQKINLGFNNNYYPNTIRVKSGIPVEITLDNSVRGCFRSFTIRQLGVSHKSSNPADTIKFVPTQKGTFEFACGMRMGYGNIVVE